jgi:hypothetical protein
MRRSTSRATRAAGVSALVLVTGLAGGTTVATADPTPTPSQSPSPSQTSASASASTQSASPTPTSPSTSAPAKSASPSTKSARPSPTYGPITLSPEESQRLCANVLPKLIARREKLAARIAGGADVKGSAAWLKARAAKQRAKGHEQAAKRLEERAQRRAARLTDLAKMKEKLETFKTDHCKVVK